MLVNDKIIQSNQSKLFEFVSRNQVVYTDIHTDIHTCIYVCMYIFMRSIAQFSSTSLIRPRLELFATSFVHFGPPCSLTVGQTLETKNNYQPIVGPSHDSDGQFVSIYVHLI